MAVFLAGLEVGLIFALKVSLDSFVGHPDPLLTR